MITGCHQQALGQEVRISNRGLIPVHLYSQDTSFIFKGQRIAEETIRQHLLANNGIYPETVAVTLWGLDTIKTRGKP